MSDNISDGGGVRLQLHLARAGVASRRHAEEMITAGRVKVNGRVVTQLGTRVDPDKDDVTVDGRRVHAESHVYLLLHKPRGYVTTVADPDGRPTVMELLGDVKERLYPVGRLDYNTDGALLLTNDGDLANRLMHPRHGVPKTYQAKFQHEVSEGTLERLRRGVTLDDGHVTAPADVNVISSDNNTWLEITIHEGRNRQIHRMAEAVGHTLMKLTRVRYAGLTVEDLPPKAFRTLTGKELAQLRRLVDAPPPKREKPPLRAAQKAKAGRERTPSRAASRPSSRAESRASTGEGARKRSGAAPRPGAGGGAPAGKRESPRHRRK